MKNLFLKLCFVAFGLVFFGACGGKDDEVTPDSLSAGLTGSGTLTVDGTNVKMASVIGNVIKYDSKNSLLTITGAAADLKGAKSIIMQYVVEGTAPKVGVYKFSVTENGLTPGFGYGGYFETTLTGGSEKVYAITNGDIEITSVTKTEVKGKLNSIKAELYDTNDRPTGKFITLGGAFACKLQ